MPKHDRPGGERSADERRVLVVDDDVSIQGFLVDALADEGYNVRTAANGQDALAVLHEWQPDVILLDLMMPEMDGWQFRARQLALPAAAEIPVIVLSAMRDPTPKIRGLTPARVFVKPFDLDALLTTIDELSTAFTAAHGAERPGETPPSG
jgi:DNA-binding response OmpR family regulator